MHVCTLGPKKYKVPFFHKSRSCDSCRSVVSVGRVGRSVVSVVSVGVTRCCIANLASTVKKIARFRTHDLTNGLSYVSTQQSGQVPMDTLPCVFTVTEG
jgi:hypothetical protein